MGSGAFYLVYTRDGTDCPRPRPPPPPRPVFVEGTDTGCSASPPAYAAAEWATPLEPLVGEESDGLPLAPPAENLTQ